MGRLNEHYRAPFFVGNIVYAFNACSSRHRVIMATGRDRGWPQDLEVKQPFRFRKTSPKARWADLPELVQLLRPKSPTAESVRSRQRAS
jgi:hypothetical protein